MRIVIFIPLICFSASCTNTQSEFIQNNAENVRKDTRQQIENSSEEIKDDEVEIEQGPVE